MCKITHKSGPGLDTISAKADRQCNHVTEKSFQFASRAVPKRRQMPAPSEWTVICHYRHNNVTLDLIPLPAARQIC